MYEKYLRQSLVPDRYKQDIKLYPEAGDEQAFARLNEIKCNIGGFVKGGKDLLICSPYVGNGKTTWASKLIKAYLETIDTMYYEYPPALFINVTRFLNEKRLAISDPVLQNTIIGVERNILRAQLVVFDDLGVKDISAYDANNLYYWIDSRTSHNQSCIYTSNLMVEQLREILDPRLYDRIVNYSEEIRIMGGSNRTYYD